MRETWTGSEVSIPNLLQINAVGGKVEEKMSNERWDRRWGVSLAELDKGQKCKDKRCEIKTKHCESRRRNIDRMKGEREKWVRVQMGSRKSAG